MACTYKIIALNKLNVNPNNPRFDPVDSQQEAMALMFDKYRDEEMRLAEHMVKRGPNPTELPAVYETPDGEYVVKDGNRRLTVRYAICYPKQIPTKDNTLRRRFKKLHDEANVEGLKKVRCCVFDDEAEINEWIKIKHTGENDGLGTKGWDRLSQLRFLAQAEGKMTFELAAYLLAEKVADEELKKRLQNGFPITTLERVLSYSDFREALGLEFKDGQLHYTKEPKEVDKNLLKIVDDFSKGRKSEGKNVNDVKLTTDMDRYIEDLRSEGFMKRDTALEVPVVAAIETPSPRITTAIARKKRRTTRAPSTSRRLLVPKDFHLEIDQTKANNIFHELKTLNVVKTPNASAVMLRVFLEVSLDVYIERENVRNLGDRSELYTKIQRVCEDLEKKERMSSDELQGIRKLCNRTNVTPIPMTNEFNGYVHNHNFSPIPGDLLGSWDNLQKFIEKLWDIPAG